MTIEAELDSLTPSRTFSRRDFARTSVGAGFAAAVMPVEVRAEFSTPL